MNDWSVSIPYGQDKVTSTVRHERKLGTVGFTPDGREFRWGFSNGAIGAGNVVGGKLPNVNHDQDLVLSVAAAVGDMTLTVTVGSEQIEENTFEDGSIMVNDGQGEGHQYKIKSHPLILTGGNGVFTLWEPVREVIDAASTSQVGLHENTYQDFIVYPATETNTPLGVLPTEFADNTYGWIQVGGLACTRTKQTIVIGQMVQVSTNDAGAVETVNYAGALEYGIIGVWHGAIPSADGDFGMVMLMVAK